MLLIVLASLAVCCARRVPEQEARTLVTRFYASRPGNILEEAELRRLEPFLSSRLHAQAQKVIEYQTAWIKRHPDEHPAGGGPPVIYKPPFGDGVYFIDSEAGFTRFAVSNVVPQPGPRWRVNVHFWPRPHSGGEWEASVIVIREGDRNAIDDVLLPGDGAAKIPMSRVLQIPEE